MQKQTFDVIHETAGLYRIIGLVPLRRTPGVFFDCVPRTALAEISAIDRVIHLGGAVSPGPVQGVARPWYMHPFQDDNLIVLTGTRVVDLYTREHGRISTFTVTANQVRQGDRIVCDVAAMLVWPRGVFHRIQSLEEGSASVNLAVHYEGFDIRNNFSIYDVDTKSGDFRVIREGHLDQFPV